MMDKTSHDYAIRAGRALRRPTRRFTDDETEIVRQDFLAYVPVSETAKRIGKSVGVIRQKVLALGLNRDGRVTVALRYAPPELVARRASMTNDEFVAEAKAWRKGINQRRRADRNVRVRAAIAAIAATDGSRNVKMKTMRAAGATLDEIGTAMGITRERVRQITSEVYRAKREAKLIRRGQPPIKTILRFWNGMTEPHQAAFLKAIGAKIVKNEPDLEPVEWSMLM